MWSLATKTESYVGTSALIAFAGRSDTHHPLFRRLFSEPPPLVTTTLVVAKGHGWFLRRCDRTRALQFLAMIEAMAPLEIASVGAAEQTGAGVLLRRYPDQNLTMTDAAGLHVIGAAPRRELLVHRLPSGPRRRAARHQRRAMNGEAFTRSDSRERRGCPPERDVSAALSSLAGILAALAIDSACAGASCGIHLLRAGDQRNRRVPALVRGTSGSRGAGARIRRVSLGNYGDIKPVGEGVSELRIQFGPGYRVYLMQRGDTLIILLAGGDKSTQKRDIQRAQELAQGL